MIGDLTKMSNSVVSNNWGSMDCVSDNRGVVSGCSVSHRVSHHSLRVLGLTIIGHISHIAIIGAGVIVDMLDPAIRKSHRVRSLGIASTVRALRLLEVGLRVVISHGVGEGVGGGLGQVISDISSLDNRGVISGGGVDNRGDIGGGAIHWGMGGGGSSHKGGDASDDLDRGEILDYREEFGWK